MVWPSRSRMCNSYTRSRGILSKKIIMPFIMKGYGVISAIDVFRGCTEAEVKKYFGKIKGPVLDRIDIHVAVEKVAIDDLKEKTKTMSSADMRESVCCAHEMQKLRFKEENIDFNSQMTNAMIKQYCELEKEARQMLNLAYDKYHLSARGYYKIIKVARTIADMERSRLIGRKHILEAIGYRNSLLEL